MRGESSARRSGYPATSEPSGLLFGVERTGPLRIRRHTGEGERASQHDVTSCGNITGSREKQHIRRIQRARLLGGDLLVRVRRVDRKWRVLLVHRIILKGLSVHGSLSSGMLVTLAAIRR